MAMALALAACAGSRAATAHLSAQPTTSSSTTHARAHVLSRSVLHGTRCVVRARQLGTTTHHRWRVPISCVALDGEARKSAPRAQDEYFLPPRVNEARWQGRLNELREFKETHGHVNVRATPTHRPLHNWMYQQRKMRREGTLMETRISPLDDLGFDWHPTPGRKKGQQYAPRVHWNTDQWLAMFHKLQLFHTEFGNCEVKKTHDPKLHAWMHEQRRKHRRGELEASRAAKLREVGFALATREKATWDGRFDELCSFRKEHGHCNVPAAWRHNKRLGSWVYRQRKSFRAGTVPEHKAQALTDLGLDWEPKLAMLKKLWGSKRAAFHVRQNVSPWAVRNGEGASGARGEGNAAVQWMGDVDGGADADTTTRASTQTAVVNGWGKASSAYEEKQQFVFDAIDGWWRAPDDTEPPCRARQRVRAMRYNYAVQAKERMIKPDMVIEVDEGKGGIWGLIIEVDEFAHKRYSASAEETRMRELQAALGVPLKIIRFNPDPTTAQPSNLEERTEMLLKHVVGNALLSAPKRDLEVGYFLYE